MVAECVWLIQNKCGSQICVSVCKFQIVCRWCIEMVANLSKWKLMVAECVKIVEECMSVCVSVGRRRQYGVLCVPKMCLEVRSFTWRKNNVTSC